MLQNVYRYISIHFTSCEEIKFLNFKEKDCEASKKLCHLKGKNSTVL